MMLHYIFLDGDASTWQRDATSFAASVPAGGAARPAATNAWSGVTVEAAVSHAFAAVSHMIGMVAAASADGAAAEFNAFVVAASDDSIVTQTQTNFPALADIGVPRSRLDITGSASTSATAGGLATSSAHAASLSSMLAAFAWAVGSRVDGATAAAPFVAHFAALIGRSAGVSLGSETELRAALASLRDRVGTSALAGVSFDVILLPRAASAAAADASLAWLDEPSSSATAGAKRAGDADLGACELLADSVRAMSLDARVSSVRARDCAEIGGCVARAFMDHGR